MLNAMQKYHHFLFLFLLFVFPRISLATTTIPPAVVAFLGRVSTEILNPLIALMFALALGYFIWGVLRFIWNADSEDARESGKRSMFWGIIGMLIMVSVFGIIKFICSSIGCDAAILNYV